MSQLPALGALTAEHLGREPAIRAALLAAALAAGAAALRRKGASAAWLWVGAPVALIAFGRLLDLLGHGAATLAGSGTTSALATPLRILAALVAGAALGGILGLGAAALARARRLALAFTSAAAMIALVKDAPHEIGAGLGALALAAWVARRATPRGRGGVLVSIGLAGVIGLAPIAARLVSLAGSTPALVALVAALGLALGARIGRAPWLAVLAPLLAGAAVVIAPPVPLLLVLTGLAALAGGLALGKCGESGRPLALAAAALLGAGLEQGLLLAAERSWTTEKKMELAGAAADTLQSFALTAHGAVAVLDSRAGNVRELRRDGVLLGAVAIGKGPTQADVQTPVLAAVLAELLGRSGGRVACLGLGDGIAAATLAQASGLTDLFLVEPDPAIRALPDDPGDLFHGAWKEPFATITGEDARSFLRRARSGVDAVLDLEGLLAESSALRLAKDRLVPGGALVRVVRDGPSFHDEVSEFARIFRDSAGAEKVLVFRAPLARGTAILLGGVASIDTQRPLAAGLAGRLAAANLSPPDLLGTFAAGPEGLRRAKRVADLAPTASDVGLLANLLGDKDALIAIADSMSRLRDSRRARLVLEAARSLHAEPAFEIDRALGDAFFAAGDDASAVVAWQHAVAQAPRALSPRLSLAARHLRRRELDAAKKLLEEALSGEAKRDMPARYLLGGIALEQNEFAKARAHFEAARGFEDADSRAEIAKQLEQETSSMKPRETPPAPASEQKDAKRLLEEARLLLDDAARKEAELEGYCRDHGLTMTREQRDKFRVQRVDAQYMLGVAATKEPGDAAIRFELGRADRLLGDLASAIEDFEAAARLDAKDARPLYALGDTLHAKGERESALDAYERGLARGQISSGSIRVFLACSDILVELHRYSDAAAKLEEAERLAPGHPTVNVNLGSLYERLGRKADAARAYRRWLDIVGDGGGDPELRRRVLSALERIDSGR